MSKMHDDEDRLDLDLIKKIELLRPTPERDAELADHGRKRFLAELDSQLLEENKSVLARLGIHFNLRSVPEGEIMETKRRRKLALSSVLTIAAVLILLFGGFSATAYASQSALPGDALFSVKTGIESTQVQLARDAYEKAQLQMRFAQRRLDEITLLLEQGRVNDVELASNEFEAYIQNALNSLELVMLGDPQRGAELSNQISQALLDYALALKHVLVEAPDTVKPVVEKAFLLSQDSAGDELEVFGVVESISETELVVDGETYLISDLTEFENKIEAGDSVKIHVILTADGMKIIREIELFSSPEEKLGEDEQPFDDANENSDDHGSFESDNSNANEDDHSNSNDDNENDDLNENSTDDENKNEGNSNEDNETSGNDNEDDHQVNDNSDNSNDDGHSNDNDNDEDDHGNDNEKDDD